MAYITGITAMLYYCNTASLLYRCDFKAFKVKRKYTDQIQQLRGFYSPGKNSLANQVMPKSPVDETKKMIECYICARVLKEKFKVFTHPGTFLLQQLPNYYVIIMTQL